MIHREIGAFAIARAEGSHAEHVGDELDGTPVPGPDHGAGTGEPLRFLIRVAASGGLADFILDEAVGPGDAHYVHSGGAGIEQQRHSGVGLFAVERAGFDLDFGILRQLEALNALQAHAEPVRRGRAAVQAEMQLAIGRDAGAIHAAIVIEIGIEARVVGRPALEGCGGVMPAELIAIEHRRMVAIEHRQVESFAVRHDAQFFGRRGVRLDEREVGSAVGKSGRAFIAIQRRSCAQQDQVEIVIVIVIHPHGALETLLGKVGIDAAEMAFGVGEEQRAGLGDDAEVHEAIVVEIAGRGRDDAGQARESGIRDGGAAVAIERDAARRPCQQIGAALAGGIDGEKPGGRAFEHVVLISRRGDG